MMMSGGLSVSNNFAGKQVNGMQLADLTSFGDKGVITGIRVLWNNYIVGVELLFNGQSAGVVKGNINQFWEESFSMQQGDYIVQVYGRSGNVINCIGIKTAKGFTKTWGNPLEGEAFTFGLNGNYIKALKLGVADYLCYAEPVFEDVMYVGAQRLQFSNNGKFTATLGKNKSSSEGFDDYDWISSKFNYNIAEVKIWHNGQYVHGIQFFYGLDGAKKTPGKHCAEVNGLRCESLALNEDEHITRIFVRAGEWVDSIAIVTDQGRVLKAGGNGGNSYVAVAPEGHHFVAVAGSTSTHLDSIQLFYDEIY